MSRLAQIALLLAALVGAVACLRPLDPANYTRACSVDTDCVSLDFGDPCDSCASNHQAINVDDLDTYQADLDAALLQCGPRLPETRRCVFVPLNVPTCVNDACEHNDGSEQCVDSPCVGIDEGASS